MPQIFNQVWTVSDLVIAIGSLRFKALLLNTFDPKFLHESQRSISTTFYPVIFQKYLIVIC
jgi:hypothetical protein